MGEKEALALREGCFFCCCFFFFCGGGGRALRG